MKKKYSAKILIFTAALSAIMGLFFAVDSGHSSSVSPSKNGVMGFPSLTEMVKRVKPAVVNIGSIHVVQARPMPRPFRGQDPDEDFFGQYFGAPRNYSQNSLGTGFIIHKDGTILTNSHVVQNADKIDVKLSDGRKFSAQVVGNDPKTDIAVIKIIGGGDFPTVSLGNSDALEIGEWVIAVGNPFGLGQTVTAGIVSAKGRVIGAGPYDNFIQTDASINPGNSGGPLFNLSGEVVGINTAIVASGQGIGFAIPIDIAKNLIPQLIQKGRVSRGYLGVGIQDLTEALVKSLGLQTDKGAFVAAVYLGGPAEKAGLQAGDVVVAYNGKPIESSHDLPLQVSQTPVGSSANLEVIRKGQKKNFTVQISELEQAERNIIGAQPRRLP